MPKRGITIDAPKAPLDLTVEVVERERMTDELGCEYALVIYEKRHPMMKDAPVKTHAIGPTINEARENARVQFGLAWNRITTQLGKRRQYRTPKTG